MKVWEMKDTLFLDLNPVLGTIGQNTSASGASIVTPFLCVFLSPPTLRKFNTKSLKYPFNGL